MARQHANTAELRVISLRPWSALGDTLNTSHDVATCLLECTRLSKMARIEQDKCKAWAEAHPDQTIEHKDKEWTKGHYETEAKVSMTLAQMTQLLLDAGVSAKQLKAINETLRGQGAGKTTKASRWCWRKKGAK